MEHLYDEVERALEDLGEKFGVGGSDLSDDFDVVGVVRDALISLIENEAESDAELKAENDAELKAEEEANEVSEETPPTLSILRRKGKTQPGGAA